MPRFPSAQGRVNHEPDSTLAVTKTCPKDGVHLSRTASGLRVHAQLDPGEYPTGMRVTKSQMDDLALLPDSFHGEWNYELLPR